MKTEEMLILGLTGAAAYLVWRMKSQKTAVVTQSVTSPVTYSPSSTAVVPEDSVPPSMPTMPMPSLPEPDWRTMTNKVSVLEVRPENVVSLPPLSQAFLPPISQALPTAPDPSPPPAPPSEVTAKNSWGEMCIPEAATVSIPPCPEGQERNPEPCSWPGGRRYERSIWNRGQNFCPTGFKPNRGAIPCKLKCTGKPPPGLTEDLVKTFQSEYYIGPDEPGNTLPKCVPVGTNVTVDPCPPGQSRACHKMAWKCPEGQKIVSTSSCGKCYTPADPNRRVPYAEEQRKKSCLQNYGLIWNSATRKCEMRK